jgi:hypothetical protein
LGINTLDGEQRYRHRSPKGQKGGGEKRAKNEALRPNHIHGIQGTRISVSTKGEESGWQEWTCTRWRREVCRRNPVINRAIWEGEGKLMDGTEASPSVSRNPF